MSSGPSDELVSQFMAFSGCTDGERAKSYLEMSGGNVDVAVSLFMEHSTAGGGGGGIAGGAGGDGPGIPDVRAPDRTRTMRLMDDGPSAMMMGGVGGGLPGYMSLEDTMMNTFADLDARRAVDDAAARAERGSRRSNPGSSRNANDGDESGNGRARSNGSSGHEDDDHDGDIEEEEEEIEYHDMEDMQVSQDDEENKENGADGVASPKLSDIFAPPTHLMYRAGGFQSARTVAKDSKRWLLVNIQRDSEFSSHALNRDVWRDELVENLVREGFILWQVKDLSEEGQTYAQRYRVHEFPHISIIDPRTGRLLWRKEGWTQEKPFTAEGFAEMAMDFCSRHSFDKAPVAPSKKHSATPPAPPARALPSKPAEFMTEDEQLQAALSASLSEPTVKQAPKEINIDDDDDDDNGDVIEIDKDVAQKKIDDEDDDDDDIDEYVMEEDDDDDDDDVQYLGTQDEMDATSDLKPAAVPTAPPAEEKPEPPKPASLIESLLAFAVSDEPPTGARIQLRMPDAKRLVRKFDPESSVKTIYAFVAQNNDEAKAGKEFVLMAGFPPKDLKEGIEKSIGECGLAGQAITVRWSG